MAVFFLCVWPGFAYAEKMASTIQEAIYLFELKGERNEAVRLLEQAVNQGDKEDQEDAYFYLGKIQELAGNKSSSNFYYQQSLSRVTETSKAYWLAERDAATNSQAEFLQKASIPLKSFVQKSYGENPTFLTLRDGSILRVEDDKVVPIAIDIPRDANIFSISSKGIWYQTNERDSLFYKFLHSGKSEQSYAITNVLDFFENGDDAIAINENALYILNKKAIKVQIPEKYNRCQVAGFYKASKDYILNCPDNALHFVSSDDGSENNVIAQFDIIQKIFTDQSFLFLTSANNLYCYIPKRSTSPLWKISTNNVESIQVFEGNIAILEASGKIYLVDKTSGFIKASIRSDATSIHPLAQGTLGLFSSEGAITAVDTLLRPLWNFNFAKPIELPPIHTSGNIYLYLGEKKLRGITPRYYGKKKRHSEVLIQQAAQLIEEEQWNEVSPLLDSVFNLEPGNAEAWFFKALYLEKSNGSDKDKQKAWSEAVRLSVSTPQVTQYILNRYGKAIDAKFVSLLPISPKTKYPQFFSNKKNLFTIDPAADRLLCINAESGELKWSRNIGKLDESPVIANNENTLAIASGYQMQIYDLSRDVPPTNIQLPGKAFEAIISENATYVSTWNGFLLKVMNNDNKQAWSRKIFSVPFLTVKNGTALHLSNLEGEIVELDDEEGQPKESSSMKVTGSVTHMTATDSVLVIATGNNKLFMYNTLHRDRQPSQIILEYPVTSLSKVNTQGKQNILIGQADQSILLYSETGAPIWKFQGKNSVFTKPFIKDGEVWIDQGAEVQGISLEDGKPTRKFSTPGGAGTPFVIGNTLFSASPKRLLYGFSL